jgi:hypothetical protein
MTTRTWMAAALGAAALLGFRPGIRPAQAQPEETAEPGAAAAAAGNDGFCDQVEGVAAAQSALLMAPEVFGSFGYTEQTVAIDAPDVAGNDLRLTAGVRYRLNGLYEGLLTRERAGAECRRHQALGKIQGVSNQRALAARAKVLDSAMAEADAALQAAQADFQARRSTAQDMLSTQLRVDELRALRAEARRQLAASPPGVDGPLARALDDFAEADADIERKDGQIRRARAWDLQVRAGYDRFLENDDESPYFAVVQVGLNLGWFLQGSANERAASGRKRQLETSGVVDATATRLRATLASESQRQEQVGVLVADLQRQLDELKSIGGDASRRFRQTVWFEWVKLKAEHEYLSAHVASLREVLGEDK